MTSLLLDTNVVIWYFSNSSQIGSAAYRAIESADFVYVSAVSVWEIAIKRSSGKLKTPDNLLEMIALKGFTQLPATFAHAVLIERLPPLHSDPFDRLLIAQAMTENLTIVTGDRHIPSYAVKTIQV